MLEPDVTIGMSLSGALTPAGLGCSCIMPLIKAGFVDWIVSTGANLYHDLHFALNYPVHVRQLQIRRHRPARQRHRPHLRRADAATRDCLMATDEILRDILVQPEFQKEMGTAELHYLIGNYCAEWERKAGSKDVSVLAAAYRAGVPCYTSSPGDSTIGMNVAGVELRGNKLRMNPSIDVNETTAFVLAAKRAGGKSGVVLWGGGSPKNFMLQTEPQIQEVLRIKEFGQDYFLQVTDARPDTGGLSGATPSEAVSWGKVDPDQPARRGGLLHGHDDRHAAAHALRAGQTQAAQTEAPLRPARQDDESADEGILHAQQGEDDGRLRAGAHSRFKLKLISALRQDTDREIVLRRNESNGLGSWPPRPQFHRKSESRSSA